MVVCLFYSVLIIHAAHTEHTIGTMRTKSVRPNFLGKCGKPKDAVRMRWKRANKGQRLSVEMNNFIKSRICVCFGCARAQWAHLARAAFEEEQFISV